MKSSLIIAAAAVMVISVASPQGSIALAQDSGTKAQEKTMPKMDNMNQVGNMDHKTGQAGKAGKGMSGTPGGMSGMAGQGGKKHQGGQGGMGGGMGGKMMGQGGQGGMMGMMGRMAKMRKMMMGKMFVVRENPYSNADIKRLIDGRLAKNGFSNLLAGDVKDGAKPMAALVDVVSPKGEFLFRVRVNRKNGMAKIVK